MAWRKLRLPVPAAASAKATAVNFQRQNQLVGPRIPPFQHILELFVGPGVEVHRFHPADMGAHSPVDAGATNADEDAYAP